MFLFIHSTDIYGASITCQALICEIGYRVLRKQGKKKGFCSQEAYSLVGEMDNQKIT